MGNLRLKLSIARRAFWEQARSDSLPDVVFTLVVVLLWAFKKISSWDAALLLVLKESLGFLRKVYRRYRRLYAEEAPKWTTTDVPVESPPRKYRDIRLPLKRIATLCGLGLLLLIALWALLNLFFYLYGR